MEDNIRINYQKMSEKMWFLAARSKSNKLLLQERYSYMKEIYIY